MLCYKRPGSWVASALCLKIDTIIIETRTAPNLSCSFEGNLGAKHFIAIYSTCSQSAYGNENEQP